MHTAAAAKAALRTRLLAARAALPAPVRDEASAAICRRLERLPELAGVRAVLGYAAFGSEVRIDAFLARLLAEGVGVFLPYVDGAALGIARVSDLEADLVPGWHGLREPRAIGRRHARPDRLEAAVVPGVGFDRQGRRLGHGGGHYDRLLARLRLGVPRVGVAFDAQIVDAVPTEVHDRPVDVVVTETATHRRRGGAAAPEDAFA